MPVEQIAEYKSGIYAMEDLRIDGKTDRDYNDIIFKINGASGETATLSATINPRKDWQKSDLGERLQNYLSDSETDDQTNSKELVFNRGYFTVGESGEIDLDYIYDGGSYKGELAIFSLEGIEQLNITNRRELIEEASRRALTNSKLGYVVISDPAEGAYLKSRENQGKYQGLKTLKMNPGEKFGFMLVPNGTVEEAFKNPDIKGSKSPLFSLSTEDPKDEFSAGKIVDATGKKQIFSFEDTSINNRFSDKDYNDLIIYLNGAEAEVENIDTLINPKKDWREKKLGSQIKEYENFLNFSFESGIFEVGKQGEINADFLYDGGAYKSELAIFSIEGFSDLHIRSYEDFVKEAASRALSNSELGHIIISDKKEGDRFDFPLG